MLRITSLLIGYMVRMIVRRPTGTWGRLSDIKMWDSSSSPERCWITLLWDKIKTNESIIWWKNGMSFYSISSEILRLSLTTYMKIAIVSTLCNNFRVDMRYENFLLVSGGDTSFKVTSAEMHTMSWPILTNKRTVHHCVAFLKVKLIE